MARRNIKVDFGHKEEIIFKGSVFVLDSFENSLENDLERLIKLFDERKFDELVLYPFYENTLKRMKIDVSRPYYSRLKSLKYDLSNMKELLPISIDELDGKRKKYTPIDFILNHLMEKHKKPHFLCLSKEVANKFASYSSFDTLIKDVKLLIVEDHSIDLHIKLKSNTNRFEII